jgi:hypothetical protein
MQLLNSKNLLRRNQSDQLFPLPKCEKSLEGPQHPMTACSGCPSTRAPVYTRAGGVHDCLTKTRRSSNFLLYRSAVSLPVNGQNNSNCNTKPTLLQTNQSPAYLTALLRLQTLHRRMRREVECECWEDKALGEIDNSQFKSVWSY